MLHVRVGGRHPITLQLSDCRRAETKNDGKRIKPMQFHSYTGSPFSSLLLRIHDNYRLSRQRTPVSIHATESIVVACLHLENGRARHCEIKAAIMRYGMKPYYQQQL